ncbi:MAG: leucine-rich repeat domain-containing protein [Paludibacteraceae bacterium]|nr:leucine-rich repeat domain-containing protein [Paludibacteraceae bacterium]MBN2788005.1 leucine-rich repeat domain-containing protein [Paludibacteraceae bacterium]
MIVQAVSPTTISVVSTAGGLATAITTAGGNLATVKNLTVTGTIDARDFKTMRDDMTALIAIDLDGTTVVEYNGIGGTCLYSETYSANQIPSQAFENKTLLESIILPNTITSLGYNIFGYYCPSLSSITIPSTINYIDVWEFNGCTSLKDIYIVSNTIHVESNVGCGYSLFEATVHISAGTSTIIEPLNLKCIASAFNVDPANLSYTSDDGVLFNKTKSDLIICSMVKKGIYEIPSSVTKISSGAFAYCDSLTSVIIPQSVTEIGDTAFYGCHALTSIYSYATTPVELNYSGSFSPGVFQSVDTVNCILYVPAGSKAAYQAADQWKQFQNIQEMLPAGVKKTNSSIAKATVQNGQLIVSGLKSNEQVVIYTIQGVQIYNQIAEADRLSLTLPGHGIFIVRVGNDSIKVMN